MDKASKTAAAKVEITAEIRRMAAVSRMTPRGSRDSKGRLLPLRYRAAEKLVAEHEGR